MGAKNPEAFKPDGGHIWTSGEKGSIYKDGFYYVPENFNWLGSQFRGIKPLVSGIGLKITDIVGEKFNSKMDGINFKEIRKGVAEKQKENGDILTRRVGFERVAYYQPNNKDTWELGKGTCAIQVEIGEQRVYLFVGVAEVEIKRAQSRGYEWSFQKDKFFNNDYNCGILINKNKGNYRLVTETIGRAGTKDGNKGDRVIILGVGDGPGGGIMNFGNSQKGNPLIGVLMGVAVNLARGGECKKAFEEKGQKQFERVQECLITVEEKVKGNGELKAGDEGNTKIDESWVKSQLKNSLKNWNKIVRMNSVTNGTELAYTYK